jgi:hypothetical protein
VYQRGLEISRGRRQLHLRVASNALPMCPEQEKGNKMDSTLWHRMSTQISQMSLAIVGQSVSWHAGRIGVHFSGAWQKLSIAWQRPILNASKCIWLQPDCHPFPNLHSLPWEWPQCMLSHCAVSFLSQWQTTKVKAYHGGGVHVGWSN